MDQMIHFEAILFPSDGPLKIYVNFICIVDHFWVI